MRLSEWMALARRGEVARRLGGTLWRFWQVSSCLQVGREWTGPDRGRTWLDTLLALTGDGDRAVSAELRTRVLYGEGVLACWHGDHARAESLTQESLDRAMAFATSQWERSNSASPPPSATSTPPIKP
ncbi:MAG: hypothetical protein ACR2JY_20465, partial [Chloroflexota bacterium]